MMTIPLAAVPSQTLNVVLAQQNCTLTIYQKITGLFIDVSINDVLIIGGVICENANRIVRSAYLGFIGDLAFYDTQGSGDPTFDELGARYQLVYLETADLPA